MPTHLILALDDQGTISRADGTLPWNLPDDLQHFKEKTTGHTVIMGSKTLNSLPPAFHQGLPNRTNIVVSNSYQGPLTALQSLDALKDYLTTHDHHQNWIIGGANLADQALQADLIDSMWITSVPSPSVENGTASKVLTGSLQFLQSLSTAGLRTANGISHWKLVATSYIPLNPSSFTNEYPFFISHLVKQP